MVRRVWYFAGFPVHLAINLSTWGWCGAGEMPVQTSSMDGSKDLCLPHSIVGLGELLGDGDSNQGIGGRGHGGL